MKKRSIRAGALSILLSGIFSLSLCCSSQALEASQNSQNLKISGPFNSGNLSVFLIHGKDQLKAQTYLTLQEALEQKKVVVHETGDVNNLTVDNLCGSVVFIQSGDIVKGGQQDRTMQHDVLLQPNQKQVSLPAFCVEHDRWSGRAAESPSSFGSAGYAIAGKELKLAAKKQADQGAVWKAVADSQKKLSSVLASPVASPASPSSYQLTLENKDLKGATNKLVSDLKSAADGDNDVVGYAFAINGHVNSADVYASHDLFKKLWPKLLNSSAVEAVSEGVQKSAKPATEAEVRACLTDADHAPKVKNSEKSRNFEVNSQEDAKNVLFETVDTDRAVSVHKNYMAK